MQCSCKSSAFAYVKLGSCLLQLWLDRRIINAAAADATIAAAAAAVAGYWLLLLVAACSCCWLSAFAILRRACATYFATTSHGWLGKLSCYHVQVLGPKRTAATAAVATIYLVCRASAVATASPFPLELAGGVAFVVITIAIAVSPLPSVSVSFSQLQFLWYLWHKICK